MTKIRWLWVDIWDIISISILVDICITILLRMDFILPLDSLKNYFYSNYSKIKESSFIWYKDTCIAFFVRKYKVIVCRDGACNEKAKIIPWIHFCSKLDTRILLFINQLIIILCSTFKKWAEKAGKVGERAVIAKSTVCHF